MFEQTYTIPGFENYEVNLRGQVISKERFRRGVSRNGSPSRLRFPRRLMKLQTDADGYLRVGMRRATDGKSVNKSIHQIIAMVFLGPPPAGKCVNHKNGIKTDNRPENLEYVTPAENNRHALATGLNQQVGESHHASKLTNSTVLKIRQLRGTVSVTELATRFNVTPSLISAVQTGKVWRNVHSELIVAACNKGINNGNSRLTENDVREIRASIHTIATLSTLYRVSKTTIKAIRGRKTWRHVD
jgi:hypothetical protein